MNEEGYTSRLRAWLCITVRTYGGQGAMVQAKAETRSRRPDHGGRHNSHSGLIFAHRGSLAKTPCCWASALG